MNKWIRKLLCDVNNNPSTRLHLAWLFGFAVLIGFFLPQVSDTKWESLLYATAGLSGISIFDKKQGIDNNEKK